MNSQGLTFNLTIFMFDSSYNAGVIGHAQMEPL